MHVTRRATSTTCDDLQLSVNGYNLAQTWIDDKFGHRSSPSLRSNIAVEGGNGQSTHSVILQSSTFCMQYNGESEEEHTVKITTFQVVAVDDQPAIGTLPSFTTTFVASSDGLDGDLNYPTDSKTQPIVETNPSDKTLGLENLNIKDEIARLRQLDEEFRGIESMLQGQKALVNNLSKANALASQADDVECDGVKCLLTKLYRKLRYILVELRYGLKSGLEHQQSSDQDATCVYAESPMAQAKVLMSNQRLCSKATSVSTPAFPSDESLTSPSDPSSLTCHANSRLLFTILDIVTLSFCLICFTAYCRVHCTNPRRRAERAALREERQTRRAYRCLARKQAWKNWWNSRLLRRKADPRIHDYEEKRTLILAQEAILETAMQQEIRRLGEAEEGGTPPRSVTGSEEDSQGESSTDARSSRTRMHSRPPTYRSRASSGRPPSYNEVDGQGKGITANGFRAYSPRRLVLTPTGTDRTPNSSVISLSPRNSSETLRTEYSIL